MVEVREMEPRNISVVSEDAGKQCTPGRQLPLPGAAGS